MLYERAGLAHDTKNAWAEAEKLGYVREKQATGK
jgi:hypothetical protein